MGLFAPNKGSNGSDNEIKSTGASAPLTDARSKIDCIIDGQTTFEGEMTSTGSVLVNGKFEGGNITSKGVVNIGETGVVHSMINSFNVSVSGVMEGKITALNKVEITTKGKLNGNITTPRIHIADGGMFEGKCDMRSAKKEQKPQQLPPPGVQSTEV